MENRDLSITFEKLLSKADPRGAGGTAHCSTDTNVHIRLVMKTLAGGTRVSTTHEIHFSRSPGATRLGERGPCECDQVWAILPSSPRPAAYHMLPDSEAFAESLQENAGP